MANRGGATACPAGTVCNSALGVAIVPPRGWAVPPPGHFLPGTLDFWTAAPGSDEPDLHLQIAALGSATTCGDRQAVAAVAAAQARASNYRGPISGAFTTFDGTPALVVYGLPGEPDFGQEVLIARHGLVYGVYAFDYARTRLTPAQLQALSSLRFIPQQGRFPIQPDRFVAAALRACGAVHGAVLLQTSVASSSPLTFRVDGLSLTPLQRLTVRLSWHGMVRPDTAAPYTSYTAHTTVEADGGGTFAARLAVPVPPSAFSSYCAEIVAAEARTGARFASMTTTYRATVRPTLHITPDRVVLGEPFRVQLDDAQPGVRYFFTTRPWHSSGFGGGIMGTYRADGRGTISFRYPAHIYRWEIGTWVIDARPGNGGAYAETTMIVSAPPAPARTAVSPAAQALAVRLGFTGRPIVGNQPRGNGGPWFIWAPASMKQRPDASMTQPAFGAPSGRVLSVGPDGARGPFHYYDVAAQPRGKDVYHGPSLPYARAITIARAWLRAAGAPIPAVRPRVEAPWHTTVIGGTGLCCFAQIDIVYFGGGPDQYGLITGASAIVYVADAGTVVQADVTPAGRQSSGATTCRPHVSRDLHGVAIGPNCFDYPGAAGTQMALSIGGHEAWLAVPAQIAETTAFGDKLVPTPDRSPLHLVKATARSATYSVRHRGVTYDFTLVPAFPGLAGTVWQLVDVERHPAVSAPSGAARVVRVVKLGAVDAAVDERLGRTIIAGDQNNHALISAIDTSTGRLLFSRPLPGFFSAGGEVGNSESFLALDVGTSRAIVSTIDFRNGTPEVGHASVVNVLTGALLRTFATPTIASSIAASSATGRAFVVNARPFGETGIPDGSVTVLDTRTGATVRTVLIGRHPTMAIADDAARRVFVAAQRVDRRTNEPVGAGEIAVLDAAGGVVQRELRVPQDTLGLFVGAAGRRVLVSSQPGASTPTASRLTLLDAGRAALIRSVRVGAGETVPGAMGADAAVGRAYILTQSIAAGSWNAGMLTLLDLDTGAAVATVRLGCAPTTMAVDTARHAVFVAGQRQDARGNFVGPGRLLVLDGRSGRVRRVVTAAPNPGSILVDGRGGRVVVASTGAVDPSRANEPRGPGTVTVLDARTARIVGCLVVGYSPRVAAMDERRGRMIVLDSRGATVLDIRAGERV